MVRSFIFGVAVLLGSFSAQAAELAIGAKAPDFKAVCCATDKGCSLNEFSKAKLLVVCFTCNGCPVAVAYEDRFKEFVKEYKEKGVEFVAINVKSSESLADMKARAKESDFNFVYALDESQDSAREYGAKVTPHLFVLDKDRKVQYVGAFDNDMDKPTKHFVKDAVDALLEGKTPPTTVTKAVGCGIGLKGK